ncbi:unnamed protein product [Owenia fusiformis]|uniref:Protein quiver n=1 Tax=Owenia fusiformis TaxID=6347 RepID=A0A8S4PUQ9_OWEFU|nr:unnamed protein product [Owenia fusiformis]
MQSTVLSLIIVAAFAANGQCLKCYNCNTINDKNCADDNFGFSPKAGTCKGRILEPETWNTTAVLFAPSKDTCCEGDNVVCVKTTAQYQGEPVNVRTCFRDVSDEKCFDLTVDGVKTNACVCKTDFCNSVDSVRPHSSILLIVSLVILWA